MYKHLSLFTAEYSNSGVTISYITDGSLMCFSGYVINLIEFIFKYLLFYLVLLWENSFRELWDNFTLILKGPDLLNLCFSSRSILCGNNTPMGGTSGFKEAMLALLKSQLSYTARCIHKVRGENVIVSSFSHMLWLWAKNTSFSVWDKQYAVFAGGFLQFHCNICTMGGLYCIYSWLCHI